MKLYMILLMLSISFIAHSKIYFLGPTNDLYKQHVDSYKQDMAKKYPFGIVVSMVPVQDQATYRDSYNLDSQNYKKAMQNYNNTLQQAIKKVGDELKADAILTTGLYVNPELDISKKVADEVNKQFKLKKD